MVADSVYLSMMGDFGGRFLSLVGHPALLHTLVVSCLDQLCRWCLPGGMVLAQTALWLMCCYEQPLHILCCLYRCDPLPFQHTLVGQTEVSRVFALLYSVNVPMVIYMHNFMKQ